MFYHIIKNILYLIVKPLYRFEIYGRENLPAEGPVIVVANHANLMDPIFMGCSLPRQVCFMAKEQLFKIPVLGQIIKWLGTFPVKRGTGDREAVKSALKVLAQGRVLGMFPEGTRHKDGTIHPIRSGAALLAVKSRAGILPMVIFNTHKIKFMRFPKVRVLIGKPFFLTEAGSKKETVRKGTEEIYNRLKSLCEQGMKKFQIL